jgi:hypothetical protein
LPTVIGGAVFFAGGASANNVNWPTAIAVKSFAGELADVAVELGVREVSAELLPSPIVDLTGGNGGETRSVQSEAPSATSAAEEIKDTHGHSYC